VTTPELRGKTHRGGVDRLPPAPVVVLARPQLGENVGTAARAMLNFGLLELRLVRPEHGWPNAKAVAAASGAVEVLNRVRVSDDLAGALEGIQHVYATTARGREMAKPVLDPDQAAAAARAQIAAGRQVAFLFGPERTGLDNAEIAVCDAIVTIPVNPHFPSLNLAQAVLVMAYAWQRLAPVGPPSPQREAPPADKADLLRLHEALMTALDAVDFFKTPDRRGSLGQAILLMLERRGWSVPEVQLMRGIVKDLARGRREGV
jgi:tRNA/rRNA methyltransferase